MQPHTKWVRAVKGFVLRHECDILRARAAHKWSERTALPVLH